MTQYTLELDPEPRLIPTARIFAATVARQHGYPEEGVLDLKIAISEACTNAVTAHRGSEIHDSVRITAQADASDITYEITDSGKGFDYASEDPATVFRQAAEDGKDLPGMGLALIRTLFPSAEIKRDGEGTLVRFTISR